MTKFKKELIITQKLILGPLGLCVSPLGEGTRGLYLYRGRLHLLSGRIKLLLLLNGSSNPCGRVCMDTEEPKGWTVLVIKLLPQPHACFVTLELRLYMKSEHSVCVTPFF